MDQIKINVNGVDKLASGLNKETTVQDIKYAMLYSQGLHKLNSQILNDYGLFEQWQSNERLLDSNVKIYKIIKMWKQVPGDQLSQVKFVIKKKCSNVQTINRQFKFCSLSPSVQKTWNTCAQKSSYVKKQIDNLNKKSQFDNDEIMSVNSIPSSAWSSSNEDSDVDETKDLKRYASVRRTNRSRNSSIKRMKQNENDFNKLNELNLLKKELNQIKQDLIRTKQNNTDDVEKMKNQLKKIDNLIMLKSSLISSLENELQRLSNFDLKTNKFSMSSSNSASSISSTDTGISSTHSDDETCFETLV